MFFYLNIINSHRYFVLHSATHPSEKVLVFNFTTHRPGKCDETCIITPAEYTGVHRASVVMYSHGLLLAGDELTNFMEIIGTALPNIPGAILKRIKHGALISNRTPKKFKVFLATRV